MQCDSLHHCHSPTQDLQPSSGCAPPHFSSPTPRSQHSPTLLFDFLCSPSRFSRAGDRQTRARQEAFSAPSVAHRWILRHTLILFRRARRPITCYRVHALCKMLARGTSCHPHGSFGWATSSSCKLAVQVLCFPTPSVTACRTSAAERQVAGRSHGRAHCPRNAQVSGRKPPAIPQPLARPPPSLSGRALGGLPIGCVVSAHPHRCPLFRFSGVPLFRTLRFRGAIPMPGWRAY